MEQLRIDPAPTGKRASALIAAATVMALAAGYLLLQNSGPSHVMASAQPASPAAPNVTALEALAQTSPTAANRLSLSLAYINGKQPGRAVVLLEALLQKDPGNMLAWNNLCVAHTLQHEYQNGIDACNRALALQPSYQLAKNNLRWAEGERDQTLRTLAQQQQTEPAKRNPAFFIAEGMNLFSLGNYDKALEAWQRALDLDSKNGVALNDIGTAYMMKKQPRVAANYFAKAEAADPTLQLAKNNLAWAQAELQAK
jgi:tetratricopeptide (TPR) repeat protein